MTGCMDEEDSVFCVECWTTAKAIGGAASYRLTEHKGKSTFGR